MIPITIALAPGTVAQTLDEQTENEQAQETQPATSTIGGSGRNFESEFAQLATECGGPEDELQNHVHFVLAAEFNIDKGATLTHQYPFPTGTNEQ